jgi:hypothetical protein
LVIPYHNNPDSCISVDFESSSCTNTHQIHHVKLKSSTNPNQAAFNIFSFIKGEHKLLQDHLHPSPTSILPPAAVCCYTEKFLALRKFLGILLFALKCVNVAKQSRLLQVVTAC